MALDALLARLEGRAVTSVTSYAIADVTPKTAPVLLCTPVTPVTAENDDTADKASGERLPDPAAEGRRRRVLAMLADNPNILRAVVVGNPDADPVLVTVGIRDVGTCELAIPAARFDAFKLLDLVERHGATGPRPC